jgi:hypothetical protein
VITALELRPQAGEEHLHLRARGVLRLVQDHEGVLQRAPAHVRQRGDLDGAALHRPAQPVGRDHVLQRVVQRAQVRIDLLLQVARQEAQVLAGLHGGARQDDALHPLLEERVHRHGDGQVGLTGPRRPDPHRDVVLLDVLEVRRLPLGLRGDGAPDPRHHHAAGVGELPHPVAGAGCVEEARDVVGAKGHAGARHLDHVLRDGYGALHVFQAPAEEEVVVAQHHAQPGHAPELGEVGVVHSAQRERVRPFGGKPVLDRR